MRPSAGTRYQRTRGHDGVPSAPPSPTASTSTSSSGVGRRSRRRGGGGPRRAAQSSEEESVVGGTDAGDGCSAASGDSDDAEGDDVTSPVATPGKQRGSPSGATGTGAAQAADAAQADPAGDAQAERDANVEKRRKFALAARKVLINEKKTAKQKLSPPTGAMAFFGLANGGLRFDAKGVSMRFKMPSKLVHPDKCARPRALEPRARARPRELRRAPHCAVSMMH